MGRSVDALIRQAEAIALEAQRRQQQLSQYFWVHAALEARLERARAHGDTATLEAFYAAWQKLREADAEH